MLGEPWDVAVVGEGRARACSSTDAPSSCPRGRRDDRPRRRAPLPRRPRGERVWNVRDLPAEDRAALLPGALPSSSMSGLLPAGPLGEDLVVLVPLGLLTPPWPPR
ncbi:hypothetical protein [Janibacter melonis]|uniref:hypothetical protein n=1 Tax=Janibacter melonis TaxID=262209 RepID=UPI002094611F|nr:hypothetical protein [Janibacter melonis]